MRKTTKTMWKLCYKTFRLMDTSPHHDLWPKTNPMATRRVKWSRKRRKPLPLKTQMKLEFLNYNRIREK